MNSLDILGRAHELIWNGGVARGAMARTHNGKDVSFHDGRAESFCSIGAIGKASVLCDTVPSNVSPAYTNAVALFREAAGLPDGISITHWNDQLATDEDIISAFAKAAGRQTELVHRTLAYVG